MNNKLSIILLFICHLNYGQVVYKGKVTDANTNQPIPYCNIGIPGTNAGTISNSDGSFEIRLATDMVGELLVFSAIGFERKEFEVNGSSDLTMKISLSEQPTILKEIEVVASKRLNEVWHGNNKKSVFPSGVTHYDSALAGGAMALLIKKEDSSLNYVQQAKLFVLRNTITDMKVRVRFLSVDSLTQLPGQDLIDQNIIITSSKRKGWFEADLKDQQVFIPYSEFYLVFEWLFEESDRHEIAQKYSDWAKENEHKIIRDTVIVDGVRMPTERYSNPIILGTFFGISPAGKLAETKVTYSRASSFAPWERSASALRAEILLSD